MSKGPEIIAAAVWFLALVAWLCVLRTAPRESGEAAGPLANGSASKQVAIGLCDSASSAAARLHNPWSPDLPRCGQTPAQFRSPGLVAIWVSKAVQRYHTASLGVTIDDPLSSFPSEHISVGFRARNPARRLPRIDYVLVLAGTAR